MKSGHIHSALVTAAALALTPLHAADVDTNPGVTLNSSSPGNKYIGNGTLTVSGGSTVALGAASGSPTTEFAMTGGLIHIVAGTTLRNGGWQKGFWTNNEAGMQVNGSFDIWDGNPVTIDALTGQQAVLPNQGVNSMKALVTTAGANAWDAQSLGPSFATTVGTEYTMTFYAKAALANTGIRMVVQNANYLNRNFSLTTQWAKYTWTFTAVETTPRVRIHYFEAGTFWIDNISVVPTASIPITLTINPEIRHQEMVGFGGSLTWYRERVLTSRHSATIKQLLFEDLGLDRLGWEPDYLSFQNEPGYVATWKSCIFRPTQTPVHAGYAETSDAIYNAIKDRPNAPIMIGAEVESIGSATWSDWKNGA